MKKTTFNLLIIFFSIKSVYAQNIFSGIIDYTLTSNNNEFSKEEPSLTAQEQATADSITKRTFEKSNGRINSGSIATNKYITMFDKQETSVFWYNDPNGEKYPFYYQNMTDKILLSKEATMSAIYLVSDTMSIIPWKLSKNTKKIQNIACFSAQAEYRGRVWTAWYAPSIPISSGPWKLYGLPGMILEAEDRAGFIKFECMKIIIPKSTDIKENVKELFTKDKKSKKISYKDYVKVLQESLNNYDKMNTKVSSNGELLARGNVYNAEIFAFEQATGRRAQQKLSDIPKK